MGKKKAFPYGFLLSFLFFASLSSAVLLDITDTDFSGGEFNRTTAADVQLGNLTLSVGADGKYYSNGYFVSGVFSTPTSVPWRRASWMQNISSSIHNVTIELRFSGDGAAWGSWTAPSADNLGVQLSANSKYIQYRLNLSTADNTTTPVIEDVSMLYNIEPPSVALIIPPDGVSSYDGNLTFNCSATDQMGLVNISLYWNYTGIWSAEETKDVSGMSNTTSFTKTGLRDGTYIWTCLAYNNYSVSSFGENRTFVVDRSVVRIIYDITSPVIQGEAVPIFVNASSVFPMDSVWANITLPDLSKSTILLRNGQTYNYIAPMPGLYNITIFANDSRGNVKNVSASFSALRLLNFTISPSIPLFTTPIPVRAAFYFPATGTKAYEYSVAAENSLRVEIIDGSYNIQFSSFYGSFHVTLKGVNASQNTDKHITFDRAENFEGFLDMFAVETDYSYSSAEVKIFYNASKFRNDNYTGAYKCASWGITRRICSIPWIKISPILNLSEGSVKISTMSLSAFGIKQEAFCGDGFCSPEENSEICRQDCECTTGETRTCGNSSIGICKLGLQTCVNGLWGECRGSIEPAMEVCNGRDDDCNNMIDDVGNGTSVETTKCMCFNNGAPKEEECNNIDDDCDSQIDEGVERPCGTDRGICDFGKSICVNGRWGECTGEIKPRAEECGNGQDDDCDGKVDEDCPDCTNKIKDGNEEGIDCGGSCPDKCAEIPWTLVAVIGAVGLVAVFGYLMVKKLLARKEEGWDELENSYAGRQI